MTSSNEDQWKVFQRDTEAGRLLSRLYGCPASKSKISYPKQRRRAGSETSTQQKQNDNANASRGWKTTYTVHTLSRTEEEEKENERKTNISRALSMKVPKVGRANGQRRKTGETAAMVDQIPRRKTETGCRSNVDQAKFLNNKYRPPASNAFSSDKEKQRLTELFSDGNGKCLPKDLTSLPGGSNSNTVAKGGDDTTGRSIPDSLFEQIYHEIKERRQHQLDMERVGAGDSTRKSTVNEIQSRLAQLRRIDPNKAAEVVKMLMN